MCGTCATKVAQRGIVFDNVVTLMIVIAGFILVMVSIFLPRIVRSKAPRVPTMPTRLPAVANAPRGGQPPAPMLSGAEHTSERIDGDLLRLEESARELFGRLDARSRVLIRLIEEAEVRAQELERLIQKGKHRA